MILARERSISDVEPGLHGRRKERARSLAARQSEKTKEPENIRLIESEPTFGARWFRQPGERERKNESQLAVREAIQPSSKSVHTTAGEKKKETRGRKNGRQVSRGLLRVLIGPTGIKASVLRTLSERNARKSPSLFLRPETSKTKKRLRENPAFELNLGEHWTTQWL